MSYSVDLVFDRRDDQWGFIATGIDPWAEVWIERVSKVAAHVTVDMASSYQVTKPHPALFVVYVYPNLRGSVGQERGTRKVTKSFVFPPVSQPCFPVSILRI